MLSASVSSPVSSTVELYIVEMRGIKAHDFDVLYTILHNEQSLQ